MMQITKQGMALIEMFEGVRLKKYRDSAGHWTIGIGHLIKSWENFDEGITEAQAFELLSQDLGKAAAAVREAVEVRITDNQYTALTTFTYNVGIGAFKRSTLLRKLNAGDYAGAAGQFILWTKVTINGKKQRSDGLLRRRAAEELLFRSPVPVWTPNHTMWAGQVGDEGGNKFMMQHPDAVVVMIAATVEETYGAGTQGAGEAGAQTEGDGEG